MQLQLDSVRYRLGVDAHEVHLIMPSPVVPASQPVTRLFALELASSQATFTPNTTSEALLTQ